jgi:hypothetical protein
MTSLRRLEPDELLPPNILGIEIKFLCIHCDTKLMVDFRWQGRTLDCPKCQRMTQVPRFAMPPPIGGPNGNAPSPPERRLSPGELAFLSKSPPPSWSLFH